MIRQLIVGLIVSCFLLSAVPVLAAQNEPTAAFNSKKEDAAEGLSEASEHVLAGPLVNLPVVGKDLAEKASGMDPDEDIRVIIFLAYQPQDVVAMQVESRHSGEMDEIKAQSKELRAKYAALRNTPPGTDAEEHGLQILPLSDEDKNALRALNEKHEALSLVIKNEIASDLESAVAPSQKQVTAVIERVGGRVESEIIATNAIVATVPAGSIPDIAALPIVSQVIQDKKLQSNLNFADDATLVTTSEGAGSLWNNGFTGGIYDPAIIDTGTDLEHPMLKDSADPKRTNYFAVYLEAAQDEADFDDDPDSVDDLNGHGTHVAGIVGSYGSANFPRFLGMSHGVEKLITLKSSYQSTDLTSYSMSSDKMTIIDLALYHGEDLQPLNTFDDDVDGMNRSGSVPITADETFYSLFYDSIISSYPDLVVTISAGNDGPDNALFSSPGSCYNGITVANVDDKNSADRSNDIIAESSTRGPTAWGRRKPDIAAPGTKIWSANTKWEDGELEMVEKSGTSQAAPMVLGVAMDLMDAGVIDEKEIKALLLNTANKNDALIDFESDEDGWSEAYGWGYMNAYHAYFHRNDVLTASVTERPNPGYYRLYKGLMGDNVNMGRDRATLVWNRHASYKPEHYPDTYYVLSNLDLALYNETNNAVIDLDYSYDNVHQVRAPEGSSLTDVVVKVFAWDTDFAHGGTVEEFSLATEEDFVEVDLPESFQGRTICPDEVEPNEVFECDFWMINNSDIASHNNRFDLILPDGWAIVYGDDPFDAGSIVGDGGTSAHANWILKAQPTERDGVWISKQHTHISYDVPYTGPVWYKVVNVRVDDTPPSPDPMTWLTAPFETSTSEISMVATTATDVHGPVEYFFDFRNSPTGGTGGSDSGYITETTYTDSGLQSNQKYCYRVLAKDNAQLSNLTAYSRVSCDYTSAYPPTPNNFTNITRYSIEVNWLPNGNPLGTEYLAENTTKGTNSGWTTDLDWKESSLRCETKYIYRVKARNGDKAETEWTSLGTVWTVVCPFQGNRPPKSW